MVSKPAGQRELFEAPMPPGLDAVLEMQRPMLRVVADVNAKFYDSLATMNAEWVAFMNRRLKEDVTVARQLADCRSIGDIYAVYAEFYQKAFEQYQTELEQMLSLGRTMAENASAAAREGMEAVARKQANRD
ncbi:MAG: phasin family protein [Hyphomicrobiaceae bacterium]